MEVMASDDGTTTMWDLEPPLALANALASVGASHGPAATPAAAPPLGALSFLNGFRRFLVETTYAGPEGEPFGWVQAVSFKLFAAFFLVVRAARLR